MVINRASLFYAIAVKLIAATFSLPLPHFLSLSHLLAGEDGQTLPINRRQRAYNNGTLIIEQLQRLEDAGTYTCMAQNKQKQTSRRNVEIQVLGKYESTVRIRNMTLAAAAAAPRLLRIRNGVQLVCNMCWDCLSITYMLYQDTIVR